MTKTEKSNLKFYEMYTSSKQTETYRATLGSHPYFGDHRAKRTDTAYGQLGGYVSPNVGPTLQDINKINENPLPRYVRIMESTMARNAAELPRGAFETTQTDIKTRSSVDEFLEWRKEARRLHDEKTLAGLVNAARPTIAKRVLSWLRHSTSQFTL